MQPFPNHRYLDATHIVATREQFFPNKEALLLSFTLQELPSQNGQGAVTEVWNTDLYTDTDGFAAGIGDLAGLHRRVLRIHPGVCSGAYQYARSPEVGGLLQIAGVCGYTRALWRQSLLSFPAAAVFFSSRTLFSSKEATAYQSHKEETPLCPHTKLSRCTTR